MKLIWNKSLFFFLHEVVFDFLFYLWNIFQFVDLRIKSAFSSPLAFQEITKPGEEKKWSFLETLELTNDGHCHHHIFWYWLIKTYIFPTGWTRSAGPLTTSCPGPPCFSSPTVMMHNNSWETIMMVMTTMTMYRINIRISICMRMRRAIKMQIWWGSTVSM